jgi:hypothetical protein
VREKQICPQGTDRTGTTIGTHDQETWPAASADVISIDRRKGA